MNTLKTMKWSVRREFWEHKGMILWAPVRLALLLLTLLVALMIYSQGHVTDLDKLSEVTSLEQKTEIAKVMANSYMGGAIPVFLMLAITVFFYCLSAMYEERRDRSILFWKSLPVSDHTTVLSKAALALLVAPLISVVVGIAASFLMLLVIGIGMAFHGANFLGMLFLNADIYLMALRVLGMLPVYILWAIPTVAWLLMVSAWARSRVFLWAVGAPILFLVVAKMADKLFTLNLNLGWFAQNVVARILGGLFPGMWMAFSGDAKEVMLAQHIRGSEMETICSLSWMSLGHASVWIGVVAGVAMLLIAARLRRWRDEGQ
jgi:ABC-2 type transport system permease protein